LGVLFFCCFSRGSFIFFTLIFTLKKKSFVVHVVVFFRVFEVEEKKGVISDQKLLIFFWDIKSVVFSKL